MKIGYMTNGFGLLVGAGGGVTSAKDIRYVSLIEDEEIINLLGNFGYDYIEMFDGNLDKFKGNEAALAKILEKAKVQLLGVYIGANFIYEDSFPDELARMEETVKLASYFQVKHIVLGGGAIRATGIKETDYQILAKNLDMAAEMIEQHGMIASYHPHLGSMVETSEQVDKLFALTDIAFCPDIAHLYAGGGDPLAMIKKYYDRIKYVHLKDWKDGTFMPLGEGEINLKEIIDFLNSKSFSGDWLIEIDGYPGDPSYAAKVSYAFWNKCTT